MLHKTKGIVLHKIKYSDTSIIVHIYTEAFGRQAYMVKGAMGKKSKIKSSFFQPLFLLEIETYFKPSKNLQIIKEVKIQPLLLSIPNDIIKSTIALFIAEILYKSLKEENKNQDVFDFLFSSIQVLDMIEDNDRLTNFHLHFLLNFSKLLGFYPNNNYNDTNKFFDLIDGKFSGIRPNHNHYKENEISKTISQFIQASENSKTLKLSSDIRYKMLEILLEYYQIHLSGFGNVQSLKVFKDLFHK